MHDVVDLLVALQLVEPPGPVVKHESKVCVQVDESCMGHAGWQLMLCLTRGCMMP